MNDNEKTTDLKTSTSSEDKRWYVIQVYGGREMEVVNLLKERIYAQHLEDRFGDIQVPTEEVMEMRRGQKRKSERKFFPGYVLVQMIMDNETWHIVRHIPGVLGFVGGKIDKPTPLSEEDAKAIFQRLEEDTGRPKPKIVFVPGEVVRIIDGPFVDFDGVVEDVNYEKNRLRVSVLIFGRSTPVELEFSQVQKE